MYRKPVFSQVGGLNESLTRNQDIDFHRRILDDGHKIMTAADMKAVYHSRSTVKKFLKQGWQNGFWITKGETRHLNHLVPMFFCFGFIFVSIFCSWLLVIMMSIYFALVMCSYIFISKLYNPVKIILAALFTFTLHVTYGSGSIYGLIRRLF